MDPGNTELLAQKHKLLAQAVSETKDKLTTLKTAAEQANTALANGEISQEQYDALQREIIETENALQDLESQASKSSVAMQKITQAGEKLKTVGDNVSNLGSSMTKNVTVPIIAMGTAAVASFNEIDGGYDTIVTKTGATGEALESLTKSSDNVFGTMPVDMDDVGIAIGEVNTRFGATGETLETLSAEFLKFAEINETDLNTAIGSTDKIMNQFGVDASQTKNVLGLLTAKAQETGISVDDLMNSVQKNGSTFKSMGLNLGQSITLLAQFEQNGVNADTAMAGLKKAVANYTKEGMSMDEALGATIDSIKNASSETEALTLATEIFGAKGANEMTKAIREGRISIDDLSGSMSSYGSTVDDTFNGTQDGVDNFKTAMNNAKLAMSQLGEAISNVLGPILQSVAEKIRSFTTWFSGLNDGTKEFIVKLGLVVAAVGPILVVVGKVISAVGTIMTIVPKIAGVINTVKTAFAALNVTMLANPIFLIQTVLTVIQTVITTVWNTIKTVITTVLTAIKTIFTTVWNAIKTIVQAVVSGIKGLITGDFTAVKNSITTIMNTIKSTISTIWNTIKSTVSTVLNAIKSAVSGVFNGVVNAVKGAMTNVLNAVKSGFSNVKNHITGLASQAVTWGKDLVMGIVDGIKSCISAVGDAVKSVADKIKSFLHFSVPDEGPLTDYESWMPDFMGGLAKGIEKSKGMVADAVEGVAADMVVNPNITPGAIQNTQAAQTNALSGIMTGIQNVLGSIDQLQMAGGGDISIPV